MIECVYCYEAENEHPTPWCKEFKPKEPKVYPEEELRRELAEAQESYRLANLRIIELINEKNAASRERDELAAALDKAREEIRGFRLYARQPRILRDLANPSAILAAREKSLRDALTFYAESMHYPLALEGVRHFEVVLDGGEKARKVLAVAPEAKP